MSSGMFTIIGGDGKEYGPATADQIRSWITAGRASLETKARAVGSEEWRPLRDYAEFSGSTPGFPPVAGIPPVSGTGTFTAGAATAGGPELAERGSRLVARLIDWVLSTLSIAPGAMMMSGEFVKLISAAMRGEQFDFQSVDATRLAAGSAALLGGWLALLVIQVVLITTRGQSIGKVALRLRVVKVDGSPAGIVHGWMLREAVMTIIGAFVGFVPMLGVVLRLGFHGTDWCMVFRQDQRCLHDLIAGTKVVKADTVAR